MSEQPGLQCQVRDGVTVVMFQTSTILDIVTIQRIARELYAIVDRPDASKVVLDFSDVQFLSSQALGVLLTLRRKADKAGTKVALASVRPEMAKVFRITNLDKLFAFHPDCAAAVAEMGAS